MKCKLCKNEIVGYGNNGNPLTNGRVCDDCNCKVLEARMSQAKKNTQIKILEIEPADNYMDFEMLTVRYEKNGEKQTCELMNYNKDGTANWKIVSDCAIKGNRLRKAECEYVENEINDDKSKLLNEKGGIIHPTNN